MVEEFYIPVMTECKRFDRVSCYFSMRALARYSEGIYYLGKCNRGRYRLIISNDVSEDTFDAIRDGFNQKLYLDELTKNEMVDKLSLHDRVNLSNLSYLIACGIVEIKFGYCREGLFHSKSGYVSDEEGNEMCFVGSNNETRASITSNYEKFHITTSWLSSEFDRSRIDDARIEFESLWADENDYVAVFDPPESFIKYMECMNKGRLFRDDSEYVKDCFYLDYDSNRAVLSIPDGYDASVRFRMKIMSSVDFLDGNRLVFMKDLPRRSLRNIHSRVNQFCTQKSVELVVSDSFSRAVFVESTVESLALLGSSIKKRNPAHENEFRLFKSVVDCNTARKLRDEQMWDSFFLWKLSKGANFSVPGSGKTSTVLGVYAYLKATGAVDRIFVIGPLSSFDSWIHEFETEFEGHQSIKVFRSDDGHSDLEYDFRFNSGGSNLILFNYESFDRNLTLLNLVTERIDDRTLLVFDEVHRIKKVAGERASKMLKVADSAKYAVVMTGTPIPNSYADAYNFLHILFNNDDYDDYFQLSPTQLQKMDQRQIEEFNSKMYPFFCRTTKKDLKVPPANKDCIISVPSYGYENDLLNVLRANVQNPLTMIIRILQLESDPWMLSQELNLDDCSSFVSESGSLDVSKLEMGSVDGISSKTRSCIELVQSLVDSGKKVILWCLFRRSMDNLEGLLRGSGIRASQINGDTINRLSIINSFREGRTDVLITNPQTLAESVSLHDVCHDAVYFEYSYNLVHLLQSKDRIHRLGLPDGQYTQYYYLESEFLNDGHTVSLDREIHARLNFKEDIMLRAIENDEFEQFPDVLEEVEEILVGIGMMPESSK